MIFGSTKSIVGMMLRIFIYLCVALVSYLYVGSVSDELTSEDISYISKYFGLERKKYNEILSYEEQIDFIVGIQGRVLELSPGNNGIPVGKSREPKDLIELRSGLCFDRSRSIEKVLNYYGFVTRHIFVADNSEKYFPLFLFFRGGVSSHAITEVLTSKGWLVVESTEQWVSVDKNNNPLSLAEIKDKIDMGEGIGWISKPASGIYYNNFSYIYGLYSRYGMFYAPFLFGPEFNVKQLFYNFIEILG